MTLLKVIDLRKWEHGLHSEITLAARGRLADVYHDAGRYGEAEMAALEVLERRQELYNDDPDHKQVVSARSHPPAHL